MSLSGGYSLFDTAIGLCGISWSERGVTRLQLPEGGLAPTESRLAARSGVPPAEPPASVADLIGRLTRYFAGHASDFSGDPLDLSAIHDALRLRLYREMRTIGWGETVTYGELARRIGLDGERAARDVGQAMGRNRIPIIIPCHRVLAAGNKLGGFSAYGGTLTKQRLLALEGVGLGSAQPVLPGLL
jgi:methylated-DNA-[protein]-cysteine S-methyltransferase